MFPFSDLVWLTFSATLLSLLPVLDDCTSRLPVGGEKKKPNRCGMSYFSSRPIFPLSIPLLVWLFTPSPHCLAPSAYFCSIGKSLFTFTLSWHDLFCVHTSLFVFRKLITFLLCLPAEHKRQGHSGSAHTRNMTHMPSQSLGNQL